MRSRSSSFLSLAGAAVTLVAAPCGAQNGVPAGAPLASFQRELLDLSFEAATAIPVEPHIKDRSRAQEAVAAASLELGQPELAQAQLDRIENWRRGAGYADLAAYWALQGRPDEARQFLLRAAEIAERVEDWRRDTVRVRIAQAYVSLGLAAEADEFEADVAPSEAGKVAGVKASLADDASFDGHVRAIDALVALGNFDITRNALESYTALYRRFYADAERRSFVEQRIRACWSNLAGFIRIELLMKLAATALDHADQAKALELTNEAQELFDSAQWPLENRIELMGRLAGLRYRAGDRDKARADADRALALFEAEGSQIVDIYRARALRPLAEAYQSMGDTAAALAVYRRAVEEGVANPNNRPRALDLSATCCSMAVHGVEPDAVLWARLRRIREELGPPW